MRDAHLAPCSVCTFFFILAHVLLRHYESGLLSEHISKESGVCSVCWLMVSSHLKLWVKPTFQPDMGSLWSISLFYSDPQIPGGSCDHTGTPVCLSTALHISDLLLSLFFVCVIAVILSSEVVCLCLWYSKILLAILKNVNFRKEHPKKLVSSADFPKQAIYWCGSLMITLVSLTAYFIDW